MSRRSLSLLFVVVGRVFAVLRYIGYVGFLYMMFLLAANVVRVVLGFISRFL